ncbi:glycosyltransferase [Duganella sp. FT50W]|uniref:Glycosyltransferase n=1 Tax=Duganella lactea TaxID=2692173 RepID=A0A6L8MTF5_9BURK|nr:glycosyltransferase family 1 protein [Duganella lactea]MYM85343.1 glycosyltransferase [Duganella lactea]
MRRNTPPQLLLDLSELVRHDARSGVQRVTRGLLQALLTTPPAGYQVRPVYDAGGYYAYAVAGADGRYAPAAVGEEQPLQAAPGDRFFGLDLALEAVIRNHAVLQDLRQHGVALHFFIHDLLPLRHPEWFEAGLVAVFGDWLAMLAALADGLVCNSRATADDLLDWLAAAPPMRPLPLLVGYLHLGADVDASQPSSGVSDDEAALLATLREPAPTLLMVGTLEPRKMHAQALDALELLWRDDSAARLVIVGKPGWRTEALAQRLRAHPEQGRRLFWFPHASDQLLQQLYGAASGLLAASQAEGFGLPLIEAARHGLPVIARELPVFREVGGEHAWYFQADDGAALARALRQWLALQAAGAAPPSTGMRQLGWRDSAARLHAVLDGHWYASAPILLA